MPQWFDSIFHFVFSSASLGTIIGSCAVAVAVLLPKQFDFITDLRKWAIVVAIVAFSFTSIAGKFFNDGLSVKQAQWDAALKNQKANGDKARSDAESAVDAGGVSDDRNNRDNN